MTLATYAMVVVSMVSAYLFGEVRGRKQTVLTMLLMAVALTSLVYGLLHPQPTPSAPCS